MGIFKAYDIRGLYPTELDPGPAPALKFTSVVGSSSSDEAKIGGMTPAVLSFSGR